jgi:hypothetical protein
MFDVNNSCARIAVTCGRRQLFERICRSLGTGTVDDQLL